MGRELRYPQMHDKEYLTQTRLLTGSELARLVGCSADYVYMQRNRFGINVKARPPHKRSCEWRRYGNVQRCKNYDWCDAHRDRPVRCETMLEWEQ